MEAYTSFARVYDMFMDNVPYNAWANQITDILKDHKITSGIVADLGCGTGSLTQILSQKGFDMIGIDRSTDMLEIAMEKKEQSGENILYLCQDMRSFELYGTCAAIVSRCDAINYMMSYEDLLAVFRLVNNYLDPGGVFIFDCNTPYKYENILADNTIAETRRDACFIWENDYDSETMVNEYDLTLFIRQGNQAERDSLFKRFEETHFQKAFSIETIKKASEQAGLKWLNVFDAKNLLGPGETTLRYLVILESGRK